MLDPKKVLAGIPDGLRIPLLSVYIEIVRNYSEHRWEPSELNGGKFCEAVYSIIHGALFGSFPAAPSKPAKMVDACRALEQLPANPSRLGDRSFRILIPRLLPFLYEIRSNRGVGHLAGEINPNFSDATAVYSLASWAMAELVRIFHSVPLDEAQAAVDALVERKHPVVWEEGDVRRVLDPSLSTSDQVILLAYSSPTWIAENDLRRWVEYKNATLFRSRVLSRLHKNRLVEFDSAKSQLRITPRGVKDAEGRILLKYRA